MEKLIIFKSDGCGHCREQVPQAVSIANGLGIQTEVVDLDRCDVKHQSECSTIEWVPTMKLNGVEVTLEQLRDRLGKK
jgi:hypothetical protein